MATLQPPPTFTLPIVVDEKTKKATFSPIWLKWFLDLADSLNAAGGTVITGDTDSIALPARVFDAQRQLPTLFQSDATVVSAQRVFDKAPPVVPDVRAGSNITVTRDARGFVVAGTAADELSALLASRTMLPHSPVIPDIQAGSGITVTRNAEGFVVTAAGGAVVWDTDQNMLANQVFGG